MTPPPKDPVLLQIYMEKQRISHTGKNNPFYNKKHTQETRQKMRNSHLERYKDPAQIERQRIGTIKRYEDPGERVKASIIHKKIFENAEERRKVGEASRLRYSNPEARLKMSLAVPRGKDSHLWRGGKSFEPYCNKFSRELKERVRIFFDYTCVECGKKQISPRLCIHHVNFDKMACCNDVKPLFVPLCRSCHSKTNQNREYWESRFTTLIMGKYNGNCYIPKVGGT